MANLFTNPDFEVDLSGWASYSAASWTRDTVDFHSGVASGNFLPGDFNTGVRTASAFVLVGGSTYDVDYWAKGPVGQTLSVRAGALAAASARVDSVMTGNWQHIVGTLVAPSNSEFIYFLSTTTDTGNFRIDDISMAIAAATSPQSKRDTLLASLPGTGTVSDRLYAQQQAAYVGADPTAPLTLNDYLVANGVDKNIIQ